ncbi:MAG TPA: glutamate-5-semialdehyde dehydrogenase [Maribacter sp.]|uniref:glutamate-5-semialdehyde dehydrogenase n=1 Tax=unclassified Maribacter TaxID=2615042 RepID=UPI000ED6A0EC|nr:MULTISPECIES: glutamate-5-semialdehyde dehydrogenase [unclassified Maribacter]HAF78011.1 glutamate-5-semialdehyde dehydrogenase [Maribacter sp.]|tara:strand:+ start:98283 stop:99482 length:1200 start_codon:yes stop_codon:yes gene_type:complete
MKIISTEIKNKVLNSMMLLLDTNRSSILNANKKDLDLFTKEDQAMYDRLIVTNGKIDGMIGSIKEVMSQEDPVGKIISTKNLDNGLDITNKTAPFGTIMIIYESRPDVTIEAAVLAFKASNKILLKGGKEALYSNTILVELWHKALEENGLSKAYIQQLTMNREETQEFLRNPTEKLDLIVPRGGERLINFVKEHAKCAVLVSGRGNNFLFVDKEADWEKSVKVIMNAKTEKISACNALDKILINSNIENYEQKLADIYQLLNANGVETLVDADVNNILKDAQQIHDEAIWEEEFLAMKCCLGAVESLDEAIEKINDNSGGHSATIMTTNKNTALQFMEEVDCAAVYQNASTRFTDGGQMGVGAELAISTDKLHHRGPLGLKQLVTNKYYIFGNGQIRE